MSQSVKPLASLVRPVAGAAMPAVDSATLAALRSLTS
jgi:hypothetical protein